MSNTNSIKAALGLGKLAGAYLRRRYAILFYSLLFTMAAGPLSQGLGFGSDFLEVLLAVNLLAAVIPIDNRHGRRLLLSVLTVALAVRFGAAWPGAIGIAGESAEAGFSLTSAIYFSFVTLATLGYGDIVPRSEAARGLATVEAVAGQLYLAVMVARLVSLHVTKVGKEISNE